jgi:hypothetical protein
MANCWIPLQEAAALGGYETAAALQSFVRRFNERHPDNLIWRRWGRLEVSTFKAALFIDAQDRTPGLRATAQTAGAER